MRVLPNRTCRLPNLGAPGLSWALWAPPRESQHQALTRRAGSAARSAPRPPARRREARWLAAPRPPGTRSTASPARPSWRRRQRRRLERPRRAAPGGRWASALGCLLRRAPPLLPLARRAHLGSREKRSGVGGGRGGRRGGGREHWGGGRRGRRERDAPLAAAAARPRLGGPGESGEPRREGGRRLAGGDSQTPVSLAATARASPGPLRPLSSLQLRSPPPRARLLGGPGRSPGPGDRSGVGGGGVRERGQGPRWSTLCQWLIWSRALGTG